MIDHLKENNKLIAEFMGYVIYPNNVSQMPASVKHIKESEVREYHKEWLWLMPVVEKIEKLGIVNFVEITGDMCQIKMSDKRFLSVNQGNKKLAIFESIVKFIKDYKKINNL